MTEPDKLPIHSQRHFPVGAERLFDAFARPECLARWWGPDGFSNRIDHFDFRPGGDWRITMKASDGTDFVNRWTFERIERPHRILMLHHEPLHRFTLDCRFEADETGTNLHWHMLFDNTPENREIETFIAAANQQNFNRLQVVLDQQE